MLRRRLLKKQCISYGKKLEYDVDFCPFCGKETKIVCKHCNKETLKGFDYCIKCGKGWIQMLYNKNVNYTFSLFNLCVRYFLSFERIPVQDYFTCQTSLFWQVKARIVIMSQKLHRNYYYKEVRKDG